MGGSVWLIIGSSDGGSGDDFFLMGLLRWRCFSFGFGFAGYFQWPGLQIGGLGFKSVAWVFLGIFDVFLG